MNKAQLEDYLDHASRAIDLPVAADSRNQVIVNLEIIFQHAGHVMSYPLDNDAEPATIFIP